MIDDQTMEPDAERPTATTAAFAKFSRLLSAAGLDEMVEIEIIIAVMDYGTERAVEGIEAMAAAMRREKKAPE